MNSAGKDSWSRRAVWGLPAVVAAVCGVLALPTAAAADDGLSITGAEAAQVELDASAGRPHRMHGPLRVVLVNSGATAVASVPAVYLDARGDDDDRTCTAKGAAGASAAGGALTVPAHGAEAVAFDVTVPEQCVGREGTLVLTARGAPPAAAVTPATMRFTLVKGQEEEPGYAAGLFTAAALAAVTGLLMLVPAEMFGQPRTDWWKSPMHGIDSPWSVKDSWLTNITALGAVLGTVLTTTGFLDDWLPGVSLGRFLGMNLLYAGLILFAPIVYSASCYWGWPERTNAAGETVHAFAPVAHGWGLVIAALATLFGVYGQLATIVVLTIAADATQATKWSLYLLVGIAAAFVALYSLRFVRGALADPPAAAPHPVATSRSGTL
ncbi:hypothetical protein [Streptomyces sp. NPDC093225]|uniref:hypothetical protein n=1 Tax=Streptomyces sp. NPDC093225 TaxID=3366034 RepID=UPI0037F301D1